MITLPEITDELVEEAASRLADARAGKGPGEGWAELSEGERKRFRRAARAVLVWLHHRPKPH